MSDSESPKRVRKKKGGEDAATPQEDAAAATGSSGDPDPDPAPEPAATPDPAAKPAPARERGPAPNPWLQPDRELEQRRSARMEDILRARRPQGRGPLGRGSGMWLWATIGVVTAGLLSTTIHVLQPDQSGIVTTFGRYAGTIGPGLNFTMPWPVQRVVAQQAGKELTLALPDKDTETLMLTGDGQLIDVRAQVRWKVSDPKAYTFAAQDSEAMLRRLFDSAVRAGVAEQSFDTLRAGEGRGPLQQRIAARMQRVLDGWRAGVTLTGVELTATNPPTQLGETFRKIAKAEEDKRKNHEDAEAYARRIRSTAETEVANFDKAYQLYRIAPGVTRERIYYETVEQVLRNNPVTIGGTGPAALPAPPEAAPSAKPEGN